jgi:hypothetical protein
MTLFHYQFNKEQLRYIEYVKHDIAEIYELDPDVIEEHIKNSSFLKMLYNEPEFVMHYNTEYWANKIFYENNTRQLVYR